jgi:N-acetylglutamate synthase-like GNAT family acetyltransferase
MSFIIRLAGIEDVPELEQLISASVRGLSRGFYTDSQIESAIKYIFGVDSQLLLDQTYFVVTVDNIIIASGGWSKRYTLYGGDQHKDVFDPLLDPTKDPARIRAFFVHPNWVRRGLGRKMIQLCEEAAMENGFSEMVLGATLPGEPLYLSLGYSSVERTETIMPDNQVLTIVKMKKRLVSG